MVMSSDIPGILHLPSNEAHFHDPRGATPKSNPQAHESDLTPCFQIWSGLCKKHALMMSCLQALDAQGAQTLGYLSGLLKAIPLLSFSFKQKYD